MLLPLTGAIFRGALSPSRLGREGDFYRWLPKVVRQLEDLLSTPEEVPERLESILAIWKLKLSLPACGYLPERICNSDAPVACGDPAPEAMLRPWRLDDDVLPDTPLYRFYRFLLRAEALWLAGVLRKQIDRLMSADCARVLLTHVLGEIHDMGAMIADAARMGFRPDLCRLLKAELTRLYLNLSIAFGHLLREEDYLDYRMLMSDPCCGYAIDRVDALKYDVLQLESRVKQLADDPWGDGCEERAMRLYTLLTGKLQQLPEAAGSDRCLWRGLTALENLLFVLKCGYCKDEPLDYGRLVSMQWMNGLLDRLYQGPYAGHLGESDGRSAYHWVIREERAECFAFLAEGWKGLTSVPRCLDSYLRKQQTLYEQNFGQVFVSVKADGAMKAVPVAPKVAELNRREIHIMLAFFYIATDNHGKLLLDPKQVKQLEADYLAFLDGDKLDKKSDEKIKVRRRSELVYGAFFYYHEKRGWTNEACARFLMSVMANKVSRSTLLKNRTRYLKAYDSFIKQQRQLSLS